MIPELSFDGCGINGPDEYRTRLATFATPRGDDARKFGPLFAASPDMLAALVTIADRLEAWAEGESKALEYTDLILDRRAAENRIENYRFMAEIARKSLPKS